MSNTVINPGTTPGVASGQLLVGQTAGARDAVSGGDPLIVEVMKGATYYIARWLGGDIRINTPINGLPSATLVVTLAEGWGVNTGSGLYPVIKPLSQVVVDDTLMRIKTARPDPDTDAVLFEGYVDAIVYGAGPDGRTATITLTHIADVLRTEHIVSGQLWLTKGGHETLEESPGTQVAPVIVTALDCVFNPNGAGNCRGDPLTMGTQHGTNYPLPIFAHSRDQSAWAWNWARVLLTLLAWPRFTPGNVTLGAWTQHSFVEVEVGAESERRTLSSRIISNEWHWLDPETTGEMTDPWARALLGKPNSHSIEGMTWQQAWDWTCSKCGLLYTWEPSTGPLGEPRWGLRVEVPEAARTTQLALPSTDFTTHDKEWAEVREHANVINLNIQTSYRDITNAVVARGAPDTYEVTLELAPGWAANGDWDVTPDGAQAAVDAMKEPGGAWENKYVSSKAGFNSGDNYARGRLWGLNTHGVWDGYGDSAGRAGGPFGAGENFDPYELFDFADARVAPTVNGVPQRGTNAVRPRVWRQCLSGRTPRSPLQPFVECSFQSGADGTWFELVADVHVSQADLRIYLQQEDLRAVLSEDAEGAAISLPEAYIRRVLRIRVTAGLEVDRAFDLGGEVELGSEHSLSYRRRLAMLQRRSDWQFRKRDDDAGGYGGNSQYNQSLYPQGQSLSHLPRDDSNAARADAARFLRQQDRVRHAGSVVLPEIVLPFVDQFGNVLSGYRPGDIVLAVSSEDHGPSDTAAMRTRRLAFDLGFPASRVDAGAVIAAVTWVYKQDPPASRTELQLEDVGRLVQFGGRG